MFLKDMYDEPPERTWSLTLSSSITVNAANVDPEAW